MKHFDLKELSVFLSKLPLFFVVLFVCSCDFNMDEKNRCKDSNDCLDGKICEGNGEKILGTCVLNTDSGSTDCNESCKKTKVCFNDKCLEKCMDIYYSSDCNENEACSLLPQEDQTFLKENETLVTACITDDVCWPNKNCPVGDHGAACVIAGYNNEEDKPYGCVDKVCKDASNCPSGWKCLKEDDDYFFGFCSNGEEGHICRFSSSDCKAGLVCKCSTTFPLCDLPEAFCETVS